MFANTHKQPQHCLVFVLFKRTHNPNTASFLCCSNTYTHNPRYYKQLVGQWIDITGVPEGDYIVRVSINTGGVFSPQFADGGSGAGGADSNYVSPIFDEGQNRYPNVIQVPFRVPRPRRKVANAIESPAATTSLSSTSTVAAVAVGCVIVVLAVGTAIVKKRRERMTARAEVLVFNPPVRESDAQASGAFAF